MIVRMYCRNCNVATLHSRPPVPYVNGLPVPAPFSCRVCGAERDERLRGESHHDSAAEARVHALEQRPEITSRTPTNAISGGGFLATTVRQPPSA